MRNTLSDRMPFDVFVTLRLMALAAGLLAFFVPASLPSPDRDARTVTAGAPMSLGRSA